MTKPTKKQIESEIEWLKKNKKRVRHFSLFGDDHHAAIDAQIEALEERMDYNEADEHFADSAENVKSAACDGSSWMAGEEVSPSENWKCLLNK